MFRPSKGWTDAIGYRRIQVNGQSVLEHRFVMEQMLGRSLLPKEVVDHINGVRHDNRPENLRLCPSNKQNMQYRYGITPDDEAVVATRLRRGATYRAAIAGTNIKSPATALRIAREVGIA
jgi:hypothetical protein